MFIFTDHLLWKSRIRIFEYEYVTPIFPKLDRKWLPPTSALSTSKDPIKRQTHWSFSERWHVVIRALAHPTTPAWCPIWTEGWLERSHLTPECCLRRSLHFFSYEFSGCFLGDDDILDDGIVGCLEWDVLSNRLNLGSRSRESLRDVIVRDGSNNKTYQSEMTLSEDKFDTTKK